VPENTSASGEHPVLERSRPPTRLRLLTRNAEYAHMPIKNPSLIVPHKPTRDWCTALSSALATEQLGANNTTTRPSLMMTCPCCLYRGRPLFLPNPDSFRCARCDFIIAEKPLRPSLKQLSYLRDLGVLGETPPTTRLEASERIRQAVARQGLQVVKGI